MSRIVIIGAGHVGSHCAFALLLSGVGDEIVLIDTDCKKAVAQALDLADAAALLPHGARIRAGGYEDCQNADIVVLAAGAPRVMQKNAQGESIAPPRLSLLGESVAVLLDVVPQLRSSGFHGVLVSITNPCDVIAGCLSAHMGLPAGRVFGTGTGLDTARLTARLSEQMGVPARKISCLALGEHGDSQIAPLSQVKIDGQPMTDAAGFLAAAEAARAGGASIIGGKGSTEFGIGTVLMRIARAVLLDEKAVLPVSTLLSGQYGQTGVFAGVPAVVGRAGIEQVPELTLTEDELSGFARSCNTIRDFLQKAEEMYRAKAGAL